MPDAERIAVLAARWQAPARVRALTTLRAGGVSRGSFAALNLAAHVGDDAAAVAENRARLRRALGLPGEPRWLRQVHGRHCVALGDTTAGALEADGSYTTAPGRVCAVLTADCLPLFISDAGGQRVGVFHVGWKGLAAGIVEQALAQFPERRGCHCWLGPAIGAQAFEVGPEVRAALIEPGNRNCFRPSANAGRWLADLYGLVAQRLRHAGVRRVGWDAQACTRRDPQRFFSHRRAPHCGRMASLIWIE